MLWKLNRGDIESSRHVPITNLAHFGLTEEKLEDFLRSRLSEIVSEEHLMLIGQQKAFQEEADLLALDKDGNLYIFELKRWEGKSENLLQVLRYGQKFGRYTYSELQDLARRRKELAGDVCLAEQHAKHFEIDQLKPQDFNRDQVFLLVTDGADEDTVSAINYWSRKGLNVVCIPYRVYEVCGEPYLLLQPYSPAGETLVERETPYFIVNTNETRMPGVWKDMIDDCSLGKAAAYYGRKRTVSRIPRDATVFLYHTGTGVIAKGKATSGFRKTSYKGDDGEEFYVPLQFDWALSEDRWQQAPSAWDINRKRQTGHRFRQTVFAIGEAMANAIDEIHKEKRENDSKV